LNGNELELGDLPKGVYILRLLDADEVLGIKKLIKLY